MKLRKTDEERVADEAARQARRAEAERARLQKEADKERARYLATPVGQAETAFERGDHLFQCSFSVMSQQAIIISMVGGTTRASSSDPSAILNAIAAQGWEIVNGSFVFVEQGSESRDKFLASGQQIAVKGETFGYYVFKRCSDNRQTEMTA